MNAKSALLFLGGFVLQVGGGIAIGYFLAKRKYQALADKEINGVKKLYEKYFESKNDNVGEKNNNEDDLSNSSVVNKSENDDVSNYVDYTAKYTGGNNGEEYPIEILKGKNGNSRRKPPRLITGLQLGELADYKIVTLIYYRDKILADEDGNVIKNFVEVIGPHALDSFGEDDAVYVRDDDYKIDYEILLDERQFSTVSVSGGDPDNDK